MPDAIRVQCPSGRRPFVSSGFTSIGRGDAKEVLDIRLRANDIR